MTRALITGAAGFIGYHLARRLAAEGYAVTLVDNFALGKADDTFQTLCKEKNVTFIKTDLTDSKAWEQFQTFDYVYHLAAINSTKLFYDIPHEILRTALLMNLNAVEWFRQHNAKGKILFTSSNEAYSGALEAFGQLPLPTPEDVPLVIADPHNPRWSYAGTKLIGEQLFIHYAKAYNFRMSIVRPHNFYGPRSGHHVIPDVLERIRERTDPFHVFGADETRSFCYIDDAVEAIQTVMESQKTDGGTYHIGSTVETRIGDLVEEIFKLSDWRPKKLEIKASPAGSVKRRLPDVSKIKRDTGWEATTALTAGLQKTIEYYTLSRGA
ncbi:MAG: SDR family NAD(P)-dependent oxidoreductase [bacterium]|nr:SDR family NAD(P)-dependent oxidoreductase [bacterium]